MLSIPIVFGFISLSVGQDANWDLRNYHLYNPWSLLTGRLAVDVAPAETPTYFNPILDVPYFVVADRWPPRVVAFAIGSLHGINIVLLCRIGTLLLQGTRRRTTAAMLALFAGTDNAFMAEIGNTMGDNTTAVLILSALAIALGGSTRSARAHGATFRFHGARALCCAGLLAGLGTGLKLTNAPYAAGLVVAAWAAPGPWRTRSVAAIAAISGVVVGTAVAYGYWFMQLWSTFKNPFYPQFNALFQSPWAASTMVADHRWGPSNTLEAFAYPLVFSIFPLRIFEIPLVNLLWPVAYLLFVSWMVRSAWLAVRHPVPRTTVPAIEEDGPRFLLVFVAVSFVLWLAVFGIGRYLIPLNLLLPLLTWLLLARLMRPATARVVGCVALLASLIPFLFNLRTWGNADFAETAFRVEVPKIEQPARSTVLVLTAPVAWMLPRFPPQLAYVSFNGTFPESTAYRERIASIIAARGGPVFALLAVDDPPEGGERKRLNRLFAAWDVRKTDLLCRYAIETFAQSPGNDIVFDGAADAPDDTPCRITSDPSKRQGLLRRGSAIAEELARSGLTIDLARRASYRAWIGAELFPYRFCPVERNSSDGRGRSR